MLRRKDKNSLSGFAFKVIAIAVVLILPVFFSGCYLKEKKYLDIIIKHSQDYCQSPYLVLAICKTESNFQPSAKSPKGAKGIMQLLPSTAKWLAEDKLDIPYTEKMLFNANYCIHLGVYYLSYLYNTFSNLQWVIVAYNAGEGTTKNWIEQNIRPQDVPYPETREYLRKVESWMKKYQQAKLFN